MRPFERKQVLQAVVDEVRARYDEFAHVLCVEAGKPLAMARAEVQRLIDTFMIASEETVRIRGEWETLEISPRSKGYDSVTRRFPIGPVSMIAPFNFPLNLAAHKIAPAIAAGCPWVMKVCRRARVCARVCVSMIVDNVFYEDSLLQERRLVH
jgi:acyl-CoA reductase-like NAD-dependent aldehyde dehydrogenase